MKHIGNFEIFPVIELSAANFTNQELEYPNGSRKDLPAHWDKIWLNALADAGIRNTAPFHSGFNQARLSGIEKDDLKIIIKTHLNVYADLDEIVSFEGGLVVMSENEVLFNPQCCGDIKDYKDWEEIFEKENAAWRQIWIGHPWLYGCIKDEKLILTDYVELNEEFIDDSHMFYSFNKAAFAVQMKKAVNEIDVFRKSVKSVLLDEGSKNAKQIAAGLV